MIKNQDITSIIKQLNNIEIIDGGGIFKAFRDKIKSLFGCKYVVLTNNGTSGLYLAYKAIGLNETDEVITGTYTYHSTNSTLLNFTKNIIFCDIDENMVISLEQIKQKISKKTKLLIIPHTWGLSPNMNEIKRLKEHYPKLIILEDCSQAHFGRFDNTLLGTFGDIGVFSMQGGKLLPAGEGGFIITNNLDLYETMLVYSDSGKTLDNLLSENSKYRTYLDTGLGLKFRPNPLGIALAYSQLESIQEKIENRRYFLQLIRNNLKDFTSIKFPNIEDQYNPGYALVGVWGNTAITLDVIINALREKGVTDIYIPRNNKPNHLLPIFQQINRNINLPLSEHIYTNLLYFKLYDSSDDEKKILYFLNQFVEILHYYNIQ